MAPPAEDRLLAALLERGEVEEEDVAWATASAEAGRADSTLDPRQARWGLRVGALLAGGWVDELVLEEVRRDLGTTRAELTAPAPAPADPYEIIRPLGAGGMGEVFLARDRRLDRLVALKVLSGEDRRRFLREARAQARSVHDGICQVYEIGERQGHAFIAMRFVDGPSLKAAASGHTLVEKVQIVRDLALALHESHEQGVIHRDVKPSNVLLERRSDGGVRPILTDFGLAREPRGEDLTESGAILGTPAYMSPEQARATERIVDRRTDVYSLGATLYEMLVGAPPFTGASTLETALAVVERVDRRLRRGHRRRVERSPGGRHLRRRCVAGG
jgi:serine/threonine protein kinase